MTTLKSYDEFFASLTSDDKIILSGGDGTINRFVNDTAHIEIKNDIYYYASGTGNDFLRDLEKEVGCDPFSIKKYVENLPTVTVKEKTYRFLNNVGFGIDGYC